jgi:hypothetical protein
LLLNGQEVARCEFQRDLVDWALYARSAKGVRSPMKPDWSYLTDDI